MTKWVQPRKPPCEEHPGAPTRTVQYRTFCMVCEARRKKKYKDWKIAYASYVEWCDAQGIPMRDRSDPDSVRTE